MCDCENREVKSIDLDLNKVEDTLWIATVDNYTFKIRTRPLDPRDGKETVGVRLFEVNDQIEGLGTVGRRWLAVEELTDEWIKDFIATSLAKYTDFFKENSHTV